MSIAFRCNEALPPPGQIEFVGHYNGVCGTNLTWTVSTVCALPPAPDRPPEETEEGNFALVVFLLVFLGGGLYFIGGTLVKVSCPQMTCLASVL